MGRGLSENNFGKQSRAREVMVEQRLARMPKIETPDAKEIWRISTNLPAVNRPATFR
jgi:hypothetical protein